MQKNCLYKIHAPLQLRKVQDVFSPTRYIHRVSKNSQNCFCHNFVKFSPTVIIFGTKMAKTIELCKIHSLMSTV